ncbi:anti-sigma factor domain-containing protein [Gelidibacter gilvus]|uniref:RNA polymerase subunit sigma-70 n=1 Tax=Gelidibacter gilvus TaxID=59602 RepID=A0A4Q0XGZ7_9FLAO|nr:anti-sigma factor [Gelidibacter gilvus]RXJ50490.1 RNA polymerase subunit sigma-70 [Gelidibacter gilvus]
MEKNLQIFMDSGLLDNYILGTTTPNENLEVESFIAEFPEVKAEYERLQDNLEILAKANTVEAPRYILNAVIKEITEDVPVIQMHASPTHRRTPWFSIAASIAALIFAGTASMLYEQNVSLNHENQVVVEEIFDLRSDIEDNNQRLENVMLQFMKLNNPETEKYVLRGNSRAKDLKTVAYINAVDKTSMIDVVSLPKLPENQTYQIWAELQDRMVNLGILDESERKLKTIPYMEDALGLSITIEQKVGSKINKAHAENSVAEITLKNN